MVNCFKYITRKAWEYVQDEMKADGITPALAHKAMAVMFQMISVTSGRKITSVIPMQRKIR